MAKRLLILEDGTIFEGKAFGADLDVTGEIVFNTGMTGYQESITEPITIIFLISVRFGIIYDTKPDKQ